ncbi:hypothetical protein UF37_05705, partial [Vibrio parahaemolyticus]|uniref:hypothetical protein n=1 Tax=Vibrio parahaemolyticus TaxID=670 RepID=UPI00062AF97B
AETGGRNSGKIDLRPMIALSATGVGNSVSWSGQNAQADTLNKTQLPGVTPLGEMGEDSKI